MMLIFELLQKVILSRALYTAAYLNLADHLAEKPLSISELANRTHCNSKALARLLRFLELNGFFNKNKEECYENNDNSDIMRASHIQSIRPFLLHDDETRWNAFGNLTFAIKNGASSFEHLYGKPYFDYIEDKKELSNQFNEAMLIISQQEDELIGHHLNFSGTIADIGGGKGQLLDKIKQKNSSLHTILFDLPQVIEQTFTSYHQKISGSFFKPFSIRADTYLLKRVLHDWDDEKALIILKNIAITMPRGTHLYIIEGVLDKGEKSNLLAALDLALLTIFKGNERTQQEFETLIAHVGLTLVNCIKLNDMLFALQCRKI